MGLWHRHGSLNLGRKTKLNNNQQKKKREVAKIVDFAVPADNRIKLKECEKKNKYLDLARELKKLWNMQVTIIPIVIGAFGTVIKGLLKGLEDLEVGGRVGTIQTTALLRTARILRRILKTWGDSLSLKLQWKTIIVSWCERTIIIIIIIVMITLTEYKERHDEMEHYIHWKICKYYRILISENWYKHQPEPIIETKEAIFSLELWYPNWQKKYRATDQWI